MDQFDGISKDTFVSADKITSRGMTYDMLALIRDEQRKLIKRKNWDTTVSGTFGFIGGFVAMIINLLIFRKGG